MQRLLELIFGGVRDPAAPGVERAIDFNPPGWMMGQPRLINALLVLAAIVLVALIYRREGRRGPARIALGALRVLLFAYVLLLINRPVVRETRTYVEPSVLAVLVDNSLSMDVPDVDLAGRPIASSASPSSRPASTQPASPPSSGSTTRMEAVINLLSRDDQALVRRLAKVHTIHFYTFNRNAHRLASTGGADKADAEATPTAAPGGKAGGGDAVADAVSPQLVAALESMKPDELEGRTTQVVPSLLTVLDNLQGQRLAGVVVITDARETPTDSPPALFDRLRKYNAKIFPVSVGSEKPPTNIDLVAVNMQDSVFKDDIVTAKITLQASGYEPNHPVKLVLKDKKTGRPLVAPDGQPAEKIVRLPDAGPVEEEVLFKPADVGLLDVEVVAELQEGELNTDDNTRPATVAVMDATVNVLYVDGYPRWEYRYIKNEMIRDKTVNISCLLTSADNTFRQEGDPAVGDFPGPITRFPETIEELMKYDVVLFGDVWSNQFTDRQLQLISDFVSKKGGGFGMIAGPRYAPISYRNTPLDAVLPVNIEKVAPEPPDAQYDLGWRPVLTDEGRRGEAATIFRFLNDPQANEKYLAEDLQPLFWFLQGATAKPGAGLVYAEHPIVTGPDGRKTPILVLGRFGAGRTLFSAIDDSWRWRYYTGQNVFDTYWVQQIRYLARSKKLGQRRMTFISDRPSYELGDRVSLQLKVLDPVLLEQLPPQVRADILDEKGQVVAQAALVRQEGSSDLYTAAFTAGTVGHFVARLPPLIPDQEGLKATFDVIVPKLEKSKPMVNPALLAKLAASEPVVPLAEAGARLPELIKSAARTIPVTTSFPLWDKWRAIWIFVLLLTGEWVLRKVFGML